MRIALEELEQTATGKQWQRVGIQHHHGINLPLFSLHTAHSCGIGEYTDLLPLITWCSSVGFDVIQLLPLNDTGCDTSPYNAISAFALNPLLLGLTHLPNSTEDEELRTIIASLQSLNSQKRIAYDQVRQLKLLFLRRYYHLEGTNFESTTSFRTFVDKNSWLEGYCRFAAPKEDPSLYQFIQYLCFEQMKQARQAAENANILLKGDIPILISPDSADVWEHPHLFCKELSAGAPPDVYSSKGQNWGFPLYNWEAMRREDYTWWRRRLEVASELYHLYRIDHIVGFFRIWAIPRGKSGRSGHFEPADKTQWIDHGCTLLKMLIETTPMLPIGEDLGEIPTEVRACLEELGICGTKVMRWERLWNEDESFICPKNYSPTSMTTVSTHDSETLEQWWREFPKEAKDFAETKGWSYVPILTKQQRLDILRTSHSSGSLFHINLLQEYLALEPDLVWPNPADERINLPGTTSKHNWTYRFLPSLETFTSHEPLCHAIQSILD